MAAADHNPIPDQRSPHRFATTRRSLVLAAGHRSQPEADQALALLCEAYWYPLYAYVRRRIPDVSEAQDLVQGFFVRLLEKNVLAKASPQRGRFRSFLLAAVKNFLTNEWDRARADKRGGGRQGLSLDLVSGESRVSLEPTHALTPERTYERDWALRLLGRVLERVREEFAAAGKARRFDLLQGFLTGDRADLSYATVAAELAMSEAAARQAADRLRQALSRIAAG